MTAVEPSGSDQNTTPPPPSCRAVFTYNGGQPCLVSHMQQTPILSHLLRKVPGTIDGISGRPSAKGFLSIKED